MSLRASNVRYTFGDGKALDGVSLDVQRGQCVALVGESGAGKTTLLRCFNRMIVPDEGTVTVDDRDVASQQVEALRRRIGYVPQHGGLLPHWTVLRNVALVPELLQQSDSGAAARRALEQVGLPASEFGSRYPGELSGGQRQRVALARAIAARQHVLLMDEPFGSLDAISRADLQTLSASLRRELGVTTLLVTHDLLEADLLADDIVVMRAGRIEQRGTLEMLRSAPATPYVASLLARARVALVLLLLLLLAGRAIAQDRTPIVVASKPFGESYLLAEMFAQVLEARGIAVTRTRGLGSTEIVFSAVRSGSVDVYPEYTGTGLIAVLHDTLTADDLADPRKVFAHVSSAFASRYGVRWLPPLGFENTFAIAVKKETAEKYRLRTLSDLAREGARLNAGFTADFIDRPDGLAGLARVYGLHLATVKPLLPALKYEALAGGAVDVIDAFSTDGLLERYQLVVLEDDRRFFPPYEAAALLSARAAGRADVVAALTLLSGRLGEPAMRSFNRRIEVDGEEVAAVATSALQSLALSSDRAPTAPHQEAAATGIGPYMWSRRATLARLTLRHLWLVALALAAATMVAVPLGLALERTRSIAGPTLASLAVLQTIPSIALLAFMVPLLGIGVWPALAALWLYALFPIARGTFTGVRDADPGAVEAAEALGMTPGQRLLQVRLPLAAPVIMAGVRTAAVITVGATTLAAFIGAGGLGEPIVTGLAIADTRMVLSGALPAAALAIVVDAVLAIVERRVRPAHL